jgi:hypothetical protein
MGRKLNDGFVPARKNRVIVCEKLDFLWDEPELEEMVQLWESGVSVWDIIEHFKRHEYETMIALFHLELEGEIKGRKGGVFGWH